MVTEDAQAEGTTEGEGVETTVTKPQVQKATFTPEQQLIVNRIEKQAREKEEAKWKDLLASKDSQLGEYEGSLTPIIAGLAKSLEIDPLVMELLDALPATEKLKKLQDADFVSKARRKVTIPETAKQVSNNEKPTFKRRNSI